MSSTFASASDASPIVETAQGRLSGIGDNAAWAFKGVRYAQARRFMPPEAPEGWAGVKPADDFGANAPQTNANPPPGPPYVILAQLPRPAGAPPPRVLPESEDCQYLNIWTSGIDAGRKRPVMVWLHGGFFYGGSGSTVDGSALAARGDVVAVSLNHRLNAFGFTDLREYGPEFAHSGNAGMLDIIAALRWIRENIEAFGGDPERVTVFGTSGGGMKAAFLMASPAAQGLIHRAAAQSGPGLRFMKPEQSARATHMLFSELGLPQGDVRALQTIPQRQLLAGYHAVAARMKPSRFIDLPCFSPVLDTELLPRHPYSPDAAPGTRSIPMILGWNGQEMTFFMGNDPDGFTLDDAELRSRARNLLGDRAEEILPLYRKAYPEASPSRLWIQLHSDVSLMLPVIAQADRRAEAGGAPTWLYRLDYQSPALGGKLGATHTLEGNLLFDQAKSGAALLGTGNAPERLARQMSSAWMRFAATGDPNGAGVDLPRWEPYDNVKRPAMLFDTECRAVEDAGTPMREVLAGILEV